MLQVIAAYDTMAKSLCEKVLEAGYDGTEELRLSDFPELNRSIQQIQANFTSTMNNIVINNTSKEWRESNLLQDLLARKVWDYYEASHSDKKYKHFFQTNGDALKAFQERARNDMQLSNALWDRERRTELEDTISAAIEKGMSAVTLSKRVSKYLRDFPSMQRDYAEKFGHASSAKNCQYASIRLARTEINMAYRSAEYERWQNMDFILGFEVKLSHSHPMPDICDDLKGKYPKDFKFLGWHPNCYMPNAKVLTNHGWKYIKDVENSDLVLSLNPETRNVEYVGITAKQAFKYDGDIVRFSNRSLDCAVTADHRIVYLGKGMSKIKFTTAANFRQTMGGFYRGCVYDALDKTSININGEVLPFDLYCELMAYWLSDGSLRHYNEVVISQQKGQPAYDCILSCLEALGYHAYMNKDNIMFSNKHINAYLRQFGKCNEKYIPQEILTASKRQIMIFLDAYLKCDGYARKPHAFVGSHGNMFCSGNDERLYFTTSKQLCGDLCELILKAGYRPSVKVRKPTTATKKDGSRIKGNYDCYIISVCKSLTATVFTKTTEAYHGMVYDLTLEKDHIMYIEQNGKCYWGSNCLCYTVPIIAKEEEYWANWERNPMPETEMNPAISEWAEKNEERIARAREHKTLPYFFRDNEKSIVAPINDAAYRARTGRTETQPVGNVEIFAGRKYAKVALEGGGIDYEIYGNPQIIAKQLTEWNKIQREINDVIPAFDVACKKVVAQNNGVRYSGIVRKDRGSALRKIDTFLEYHGSFYNLTDLVRCNISCRADEFHKVVQNVRDNLKLIKDQSTRQYTHQFKADKYICRFMNPQFDNGVVGEIMVTPFEMVCARENEFMARKFVGDDIYEMVLKKAKQHNVELGRGHEFYERYRAAKDNVEKALVGKEMDSYYELIQKCNPFEKGLANKDEDIRLMLKLAAQSKDEVLDKARMLAEEFGGTYTTSHATKTFDSLKRKVLKDGTTPYMMKDTVRTTVIVEEGQIEACKAAAQKIDGFARLKVQLPEKMDGYSGNIVNVETNNGIFGEIQINTPEMIYGKQDGKTALSMLGEKRYNAIRKATGVEGGLGHDLYEVIRVLDGDTPQQAKIKDLLVADSKEYYSYFASNSPYKKTRTAGQLVKDIKEHIEQSKSFLKPKVK